MFSYNYQMHRPLREVVYEQIKLQILTGKIKPGTRMMEVEVANEMGVSRTPVREAIRKLEKEGLITIEPRRGAYVSDISVKDMVDILEVREDLEGLAASLAAERITKEQLSEMEEVTRSYSKAIADNDTEAIIKYDEQFHKLIVNSSGNNTLISLSETIQDLALRFRYLYYDDFSRYENMPSEHKHIMEAIVSGDKEAARRVADSHVGKLKKFIMDEDGTNFKQI